MQPLLKDPAAQRQVDRDGYVVVPLFDRRQVDGLLELYAAHVETAEVAGLYESSRHKPYAVNRVINETIRDAVAAAGQTLFLPSTIYGGSFMVKAGGRSEVLPLHQDWSVVDEHRHQTLFAWCPLVDVDRRNGCLFVLPGSHRYFDVLRSGSYPSNRYPLPPSLHVHTVDVPLTAGHAILYRDALFHGSYANGGDRDRIVVTARLMEPEARLLYFHRASDDAADVFEADEAFYLTHIDALATGRLPAGARPASRQPYRHTPITDASLHARIREHFPAPGPIAMTSLFTDPRLQDQFERDGYAVLDLIDRAQVDELRAFYDGLEHAPAPPGGFQVSLDNDRPDFVRRVSERLTDAVRGDVGRYFQHHQIFTASFVTKSHSTTGVVPPHQDWTFVDESRFWSATIWCPLVDVDEHNGALGVIKGSHRFYDHVRPSPSPQYAPPFAQQLGVIFPYLTLVPLEAGQAIVFDNRTLHASPPNTTDRTRIAFGIGITHRDAQLRHYYLLPGQEAKRVEGFDVDREFFFAYNNARLTALHARGARPDGLTSAGVFALEERSYDDGQLTEAMAAAGNVAHPELAARVAAIYGTAPAPVAGGAQPPQRPFWKVYTPINILREIHYRLRPARPDDRA